MSHTPFLHLHLHLCVLITTVAAHYVSTIIQCEGHGSFQNMTFSTSMMYDMQDFLSYDSSQMRFVGYGEFGLGWAEDLNKDPALLKAETDKVLVQCELYRQKIMPGMNRTVEPQVVLKSLTSESSSDLVMLMCSAYDFFPKDIKVTWLRDGEPISGDVISTEELPDGDWYHQIHSQLEHRPSPGEKISCKVEHQSLTQPIVYTWDSSLRGSERFMMVVGVVALLIGFITAVSGLTYYYIKTPGWTPVNNSESLRIV